MSRVKVGEPRQLPSLRLIRFRLNASAVQSLTGPFSIEAVRRRAVALRTPVALSQRLRFTAFVLTDKAGDHQTRY